MNFKVALLLASSAFAYKVLHVDGTVLYTSPSTESLEKYLGTTSTRHRAGSDVSASELGSSSAGCGSGMKDVKGVCECEEGMTARVKTHGITTACFKDHCPVGHYEYSTKSSKVKINKCKPCEEIGHYEFAMPTLDHERGEKVLKECQSWPEDTYFPPSFDYGVYSYLETIRLKWCKTAVPKISDSGAAHQSCHCEEGSLFNVFEGVCVPEHLYEGVMGKRKTFADFAALPCLCDSDDSLSLCPKSVKCTHGSHARFVPNHCKAACAAPGDSAKAKRCLECKDYDARVKFLKANPHLDA